VHRRTQRVLVLRGGVHTTLQRQVAQQAQHIHKPARARDPQRKAVPGARINTVLGRQAAQQLHDGCVVVLRGRTQCRRGSGAPAGWQRAQVAHHRGLAAGRGVTQGLTTTSSYEVIHARIRIRMRIRIRTCTCTCIVIDIDIDFVMIIPGCAAVHCARCCARRKQACWWLRGLAQQPDDVHMAMRRCATQRGDILAGVARVC